MRLKLGLPAGARGRFGSMKSAGAESAPIDVRGPVGVRDALVRELADRKGAWSVFLMRGL
jgi:hypothetical protein